jgi:hypothetical protein
MKFRWITMAAICFTASASLTTSSYAHVRTAPYTIQNSRTTGAQYQTSKVNSFTQKGQVVGLRGQSGIVRFANQRGDIIEVPFDSNGSFKMTLNSNQTKDTWCAWTVRTARTQYGMVYSYLNQGVLTVKVGPNCKVVGANGVGGVLLINDRGNEIQANIRTDGTVDYEIYPWVQILGVTLNNNQTFDKGQFSVAVQQGVYNVTIHASPGQSVQPPNPLSIGDGFSVSSFTSNNGSITVSGVNPNVHYLWFSIEHEGQRKESDSIYAFSNTGQFSVPVRLRYGTGSYTIQMFESSANVPQMYGIPTGVDPMMGRTITFKVTNQYPTNPDLMPADTIPSDAPQIVTLAKQITAGCTTNYDKAKAIYDWVTKHISYDYGNIRLNQWCQSHNLTGLGANQALLVYEVLETHSAECVGYAKLVAALNRAAGIPTALATGPADNIYHAWDYVTIDGRSFNEDACWGVVDPKGNFDPDPATFAKTHKLIQVSH